MFPDEREMKVWLSNLCGNNSNIENTIRSELKKNKPLLRTISYEFEIGNIESVKDCIKSFMESEKIYIYNCKICKSKSIFNDHNYENHICGKCEIELLTTKDTAESNQRKKCMYCSNPVMPIEKANVCYTCNNYYLVMSYK